MARGIVIEIIGDATSYLRSAEATISANTKVDASFKAVSANAKLSADAQVAASLKATESTQAQVIALRELAASSTASAATRERAALLATDAETRLARAQGLTVLGTRQMSGAVKEGEKDLNKLVRGGLAGSGALSALGRSLAFASSGFIAFAIGAGVIKESIGAAQDEAVAQRQVARQLQTTGKSWTQYGGQIDKVLLKESHLAGFTKAELLQAFGFLVRVGGNVQNSLKLTALAADISRARNISLAAASIALSKALGGSATALRRLGIIVPKGVSTTAALAFVTEKFAGQARAGTTVTEKFHATLVDAGATIGRVLLPTFNRLTGEFTDWLAKMQESGRLQKDFNAIVSDTGAVFHALGAVIRTVDDVTGSFKRTIELLIGFRLATLAAGWVTELRVLAATWGLVGGAATEAGAAQTAALSGAGAVGAARGGLAVEGAAAGGLLSGGLAGRLANRARFGPSTAAVNNVKMYTEGAAASGAAAATAGGKIAKLTSNIGLVGIAAAIAVPKIRDLVQGETSFVGRHLGGRARDIAERGFGLISGGALGKNPFSGIFGGSDAKPVAVKVVNQPSLGQHNLLSQAASSRQGALGRRGGPAIFASFTDPILNQLAQARAALTKTTRDDVAAAKAEVAIIKKMIASGHLKGQSLIQALGAEAAAISTIQSAEAAAAQKRAAAAQKIQQQIEASIDPLRLEVALSQAQALGKPFVGILKQLRAAARKALDSGKLTLAQQKEAWDQIASLNQQIKDALTTSTAQFQVPAKLAFRLARDTALGRSTTKDLLSIRKAILRFIATHKHNLAALTDAYNQLADINQQLGSTAGTALGLFKQASTRALTQGLGLTDEQRKRLRARLSQLGPGQTVPGKGVGAAGFVIGPDGRPIQVHGRGPTISGRDTQTVSPARFNRLIRVLEQTARRPIRVVVDLDGRIIADNTTRHQQNHRNRNSSQRRGPNAGLAGA